MLVLDRYEGDCAIIEVSGNGVIVNSIVDRKLVSPRAKAGSVLVKTEDGSFIVDDEATEERSKTINLKFERLWDDE